MSDRLQYLSHTLVLWYNVNSWETLLLVGLLVNGLGLTGDLWQLSRCGAAVEGVTKFCQRRGGVVNPGQRYRRIGWRGVCRLNGR